jgi:transcriptional regulator with XRE-family HTH domain
MKLQPKRLQKALSDNIKKYRKEKGLSQEKLALTSGVDRSYMSEIERCLANPSLDLLLKISNALDIEPSKLLEL